MEMRLNLKLMTAEHIYQKRFVCLKQCTRIQLNFKNLSMKFRNVVIREVMDMRKTLHAGISL